MLRPILNFNKYGVDETGTVYSTRGRKLCQYVDNVGYKQVVLYKKGKRHYKRVHRLVYEAFNGEIPSEFIVNHIDEDKQNNNLSNLELVTPSENIRLFYVNNPVQEYDVSVYSKEDGSLVQRFTSIKKLCQELKLNRKTVVNIIKGNKKVNNYPYTFVRN